MSAEFRWTSRAHKADPEEETCSVTDSSVDDNWRKSEIETYSDRIGIVRASDPHVTSGDSSKRPGEKKYIKTLTVITTWHPAKQSLTTQQMI